MQNGECASSAGIGTGRDRMPARGSDQSDRFCFQLEGSLVVCEDKFEGLPLSHVGPLIYMALQSLFCSYCIMIQLATESHDEEDHHTATSVTMQVANAVRSYFTTAIGTWQHLL